ncbi:fructose-bisphosphatase class I [Helicobacter valdiviensis]|uniref:Fructose-1,6-bisphosphatase class 1 n=1 Tax=Helicobacter valdiviensis TaxID=1458358 RepID=A0A2W6NEN5_9HELI|nr:class 1 fructose-bisphosphatase [Helicobacter valdiviensis]PZT47440.1 fructose-bisphosphatase class I [Helicobacter valdiviensis]
MIKQELEEILSAFKRATLPIYEVLKTSMGEYATSKNQTGDLQLEADIRADLILQEIFKEVKCIKQICSEEQENAIELHKDGIYSIAYDPLDGSSLMGANLSVGSIFGIYKGDFLPQNLVGAAYVVYGMVIGLGFASVLKEGVDYYVFNGKDFALQKTLLLKEKGKLNATGGTQANWSKSHKELIESLFNKGYRLRYSGGMVPDLHHILVKGGGLFSYPSTQDAPKGKLRKLFEVFPFAFIYERAGGEAIDGKKRLLDLQVEHLHDTTPCFFGSKEEIEYARNH